MQSLKKGESKPSGNLEDERHRVPRPQKGVCLAGGGCSKEARMASAG